MFPFFTALYLSHTDKGSDACDRLKKEQTQNQVTVSSAARSCLHFRIKAWCHVEGFYATEKRTTAFILKH